MNVLQERIKKEGKVLPGNIIKVDGFLNHRVDVKLMREMAKEFGRLFDLPGITAVLTVEEGQHGGSGGGRAGAHDFRQKGQERQYRRRPVQKRDILLYI